VFFQKRKTFLIVFYENSALDAQHACYRTYRLLDNKHEYILYQKERISLGQMHKKTLFSKSISRLDFQESTPLPYNVYFKFFFSHDLITPFFKIIFA